jgi:putative ABC transport system permease protein
MSGVGVHLGAAASARRVRSSLLIGFVVWLASAGLAASIIVRGDAGDRVDAAFARADAAELVLYVEPVRVDELRAVLDSDPHVTRIGEPVSSTDGELGDRDRTPIEIRTASAPDAFNAPVVTEGRVPADGAETLFDAALAEDAGIALGDSVTIVTGGQERELDVVGLGYDFSDCLYPSCDPAHVWVSGATFEAVRGGDVAMMLPVDVSSPSAIAAVVTHVREQLGDGLLGSNDWPDTRGDFLVETEFFGAFLGAFGLFVLVSSAVVIASAIGARTMARRRAIALYKAVGFTGPQLTRAILLEHLLIAACATIAGWVTATVLGRSLRIGSLRLLEAGTMQWDAAALLATAAVTLVIVAAATLVPAWRAGRVDVTAALTGSTRASRRRALESRGLMATDAPMPAALAVNALAARLVRSAFNVLAIVVAVVAAIVSVSILRSIDRVVLDPALAGDPADVELQPADRFAPPEVERMLDLDRAVGAWFSFVDDTATVSGSDVHIRAVGGDPARNGFVVGEGRLPSGAGEAAAGYGLLRARGWQVGDRITIAVRDTSFDVELVGWYRETEDSGEVLQVRMEDYSRLADDVRPTYGVLASHKTTTESLRLALVDEFGSDSSIRPNEPDGSGLTPFRVALGVMTLLIAVVAAAHVLASVLTTQRESRRRLGIQRAVGFEASQLMWEGVVHGLVLAAVALLVGIPLGWYTQGAIGDLLTSEIGIGPGMTFGPTRHAILVIAGATLMLGALATAAATWPSLRRPADSLLADE